MKTRLISVIPRGVRGRTHTVEYFCGGSWKTKGSWTNKKKALEEKELLKKASQCEECFCNIV